SRGDRRRAALPPLPRGSVSPGRMAAFRSAKADPFAERKATNEDTAPQGEGKRTDKVEYPRFHLHRPARRSDLSLSQFPPPFFPATRSRIWRIGSTSTGTGFLWNTMSFASPVTLPRTSIFSSVLLIAGGIERTTGGSTCSTRAQLG